MNLFKKNKNTEEEVLEYLFGEEYTKTLLDERKRQKNGEEEKKEEAPVLKEIRTAKFLTFLISFIGLLLLVTLLTVTFYPKSLHYIGLIKEPSPMTVEHILNDKDIALSANNKTQSLWQDRDFIYQSYYEVNNLTNDFLYIIVNVQFFDVNGKILSETSFIPGEEVIAPTAKKSGFLKWDKRMSLNATKAIFTWEITRKSEDVFNIPEETESEESTSVENELIDPNQQ